MEEEKREEQNREEQKDTLEKTEKERKYGSTIAVSGESSATSGSASSGIFMGAGDPGEHAEGEDAPAKKPRKRRPKKKKSKKSEAEELTMNGIIREYGLTRNLIDLYLPEPREVPNQTYKSAAPIRLWRRDEVERCIAENKGLRKAVQRHNDRQQKAARKQAEKQKRLNDAAEFLTQFSPDALIEEGRWLNRRFVLHVGPTNSGKTYAALQALKTAESGVYLGPLRLLALEVYETLCEEDHMCSLLTGEEYIEIPGAKLTASTIELCDYTEEYEVAVIDEAQLLADSNRGHHWLKAICAVNATEVHVCLAPEAEAIVIRLIEEMGAEYTVEYHERLVPLKYKGVFRGLRDVRPGDALIAFSRKKVLQIAAALEKTGVKASVIYGALPPASRREEVRRFADRETQVVAATDAIGMGISLPIRRVVFMETMKYDGISVRDLTDAEIKQIAGRAGRFGKYDLGEVQCLEGAGGVGGALRRDVPDIEYVTLGFPDEALTYDYPLIDLLKLWNELPESDLFKRTDMQDAVVLLTALGKVPADTPKALIYSLITCPVDTKSDELVEYWAICSHRIIEDGPVPKPMFPEDSLTNCELKYRAYDTYHQLLRRIGIEDDCLEEKAALSEKINEFLKEDKTAFLRRCRICGRELALQSRFDICEKCFHRGFGGRRR